MENKDNEYLEWLKSKLQSYTKAKIEICYFKEYIGGNANYSPYSVDVSENTINIVIVKQPSTTYNAGIIQSMYLSAFVYDSMVEETIRVLETYAKDTFNKKHYIDNVLFTENFQTPSVNNAFQDYNSNKGCEITMYGTVVSSEGVVDAFDLYILDELVPFISISLTATSSQTAQVTMEASGTYQSTTKALNNSLLLQINLRILNDNKEICTKAREICWGSESPNLTIPLRLVYSDGVSKSANFIIANQAIEYTNTTTPILNLTLVEKYE